MNYLQKKKLAFMSIVNRVKGFVRTITGALPLTLEGCVDEESIIDYTLYGQSVQNGTPTPETPVEVESVGEYDETTGKYKIPIKVSGKNLIPEWKVGWIPPDTGVLNETSYPNRRYTDYIPLKAGKTYIFSGNLATNTNRTYYDMNYNCIGGAIAGAGNKKMILNVPSDRFVRLSHPGTGTDDFQLEEGTTATEYEPYHEPITTNIYLDEPLGAGQSINYKKDGLPNLPTFKGTSIISADTTIQPSNAEIEYYSNVKE